MKEYIYSIYKITNIITNKSYIGFSKDYQSRWEKYYKIQPNKNYNRHIDRSISKYNIENFSFEVIYQSKDKDYTFNIMEDYFIDLYNTRQPNGYNMKHGGGYTHVDDYKHLDVVKQQISNTLKQYFKDHPEAREKISNDNKNRIRTEEYKQNLSNALKSSEKHQKGRISAANALRERWKNPTKNQINGIEKTRQKAIGRPLSDSHRASISANNRSGMKWTIKFNNQTHTIVGSINDWAKEFGTNGPTLFDALKRTNSGDDYKDRTKTITGNIKQGKFKGLQVTREYCL